MYEREEKEFYREIIKMKRKTKRQILMSSLSLLGLVIGYFLAYYLYGMRALNEVVEKYNKEIELYKKDYSHSCYVLTEDVKEGEEVEKEDFVVQLIPQNLFSEGLIVDISELEGAKYARSFSKNSMVYKDMFYHLKDLQEDLRKYELGAISLSNKAEVSDYVDVRINFPSGLDYVVLAKKKIEGLSYGEEEKGEVNAKVICTFFLTSEEILRLSSALVDAYLTEGAFLYTTTYVSAHNQKEARVTYPSNEAVQELMSQDPNVVKKAIVELESSKRKLLNRSLISYNENEQLQLLSTLKPAENKEGLELTNKSEGDGSADEEKKETNKEKKADEKTDEADKDKDEKIDIRNSNSID